MNKPHRHAEAIKAWADGAEIECRQMLPSGIFTQWGAISSYDRPAWDATEYRVKAPKAYPVTAMSDHEIYIAFEPKIDGLWGSSTGRNIANAALRHAIDAGQVIVPTKD